MDNLRAVEIKAFVPARSFELSKRFYQDLGFVKASDAGGIADRVGAVEQRRWRVRDFTLCEPSGVLWRIAQNTD